MTRNVLHACSKGDRQLAYLLHAQTPFYYHFVIFLANISGSLSRKASQCLLSEGDPTDKQIMALLTLKRGVIRKLSLTEINDGRK